MLRVPRLVHVFRQAPLRPSFPLERSLHGQFAKLPPWMKQLRRNFASPTSHTARPSLVGRRLRKPPSLGGRQTRPNSSKEPGEEILEKKNLSLSERMKQMSRKYGWIVVGIYFGLSVLDFPFCFLAVRFFGTERIAEIEHTIVSAFWGVVEKVIPSLKEQREQKAALATAAEDATRDGHDAGVVSTGRGDNKHEDPSIWTQLLLAYGVHKSLIFFRIPITLAVTPKVVKTLRKWGWNIGKPKPTT